MSHTGTVIRPTQSPGLVRLVTLGYAIAGEDEKTLVLAVPPDEEELREKDNETKGELAVKAAQERFIIFLSRKFRKLKHGDGVRFNLKLYGEGNEKDEIPKRWEGRITKKNLDDLREAIPQIWRDKLPDKEKFRFKYVATRIRRLPKKFILDPLYRFIRDMDPDTTDDVLMALRDIGNKKQGFKLNENFHVKINHKLGEDEISKITLASYRSFERGENSKEKCPRRDFETIDDLKKIIEKYEEHSISSKREIPTREGRR